MTAASAQRANGLVARSSATVDGVVGAPAARAALTRAVRAATSSLAGSTAAAKRRFAAVYSWPK